jgi:hypothetical protein
MQPTDRMIKVKKSVSHTVLMNKYFIINRFTKSSI